MGTSPRKIVCPVCQHVDMIGKVSAIVAAGTMTSSNTNGMVTSHTLLGQKLSPPLEPAYESVGCAFTSLLFLCGVFVTWVVVVLIINSIGYNAPFFNVKLITPRGILTMGGLITLLVAEGLVALVIILVPRHQASITEKDASYLREREKWGVMMRLWNNLYYCQRDDVVFISGVAQYAHSDDVQPFLADLATTAVEHYSNAEPDPISTKGKE